MQRCPVCGGTGLPPSWARAPDAERTLRQQLQDKQNGDGLAPAGTKTWRRKFLWFPGDLSRRPPFYGSCSRVRYGSQAVGMQRSGHAHLHV